MEGMAAAGSQQQPRPKLVQDLTGDSMEIDQAKREKRKAEPETPNLV